MVATRKIFQLLLLIYLSYITHCKILRVGKEFFARFLLVDTNARITSDIIRTVSKTESQKECSMYCVREEECVSFNRHNEKGTCELLDVSKFDGVSLLRRDKGWSHFETNHDLPNVGHICSELSPCKEYEVCEDTYRKSKPYICRCRDGFKGRECKKYIGPGSSIGNPASSCRLMQMKFKSFADDNYWLKGRNSVTRCERRVDGRYSEWSSFEPCSSISCGAQGTKKRNRTCTNPPPKGGGQDCRQLGKSHEVKSCDGPCTYFTSTPHTLKKNTLLGTISTLDKEFKVQFQLKMDPSKIVNQKWYNVLHFTKGGDHADPGDRMPAIFLSGQMQFFIASFINGKGTPYYFPAHLGDWINIEISQRLEGGKYMYRVVVDDKIKEEQNDEPRVFKDLQIYASDNFRYLSHGEIRYLLIEGVSEIKKMTGYE